MIQRTELNWFDTSAEFTGVLFLSVFGLCLIIRRQINNWPKLWKKSCITYFTRPSHWWEEDLPLYWLFREIIILLPTLVSFVKQNLLRLWWVGTIVCPRRKKANNMTHDTITITNHKACINLLCCQNKSLQSYGIYHYFAIHSFYSSCTISGRCVFR